MAAKKHPDTKRLDLLERAAQFAVILSGSAKEGFYVSTGTAYLRVLRPDLRAAIDALFVPRKQTKKGGTR